MTDELISKELLLKEVDEVIAQYNWAEDGVIMDTLMCIRDMVFDQPTAYDIDKVIEQLKEKSVAYCREYCCAEDENILYLPDAIEIVKKGGVE